MATEATWRPHEKHGRLTEQRDLPDRVFAFPEQRKEPLTDASHVRDAVARFDQVINVSDADRALAFTNIQKAAQYGVNLSETDWHQLGVHPQQNRKAAAAKAAATRRAHERGATTGREQRLCALVYKAPARPARPPPARGRPGTCGWPSASSCSWRGEC
jgi:hypothetical protein